MAKRPSLSGNIIESNPKIRQGTGAHTKYAATSRNGGKEEI